MPERVLGRTPRGHRMMRGGRGRRGRFREVRPCRSGLAMRTGARDARLEHRDAQQEREGTSSEQERATGLEPATSSLGSWHSTN